MEKARDLDILEGGHGGEEVEGLEHEADVPQPELRQCGVLRAGNDTCPVDLQVALCGDVNRAWAGTERGLHLGKNHF